MKVQIRTTCSFCDGEAYVPIREVVSCTGEHYTQHRRCAFRFWSPAIQPANRSLDWTTHRIQSVGVYKLAKEIVPQRRLQLLKGRQKATEMATLCPIPPISKEPALIPSDNSAPC